MKTNLVEVNSLQYPPECASLFLEKALFKLAAQNVASGELQIASWVFEFMLLTAVFWKVFVLRLLINSL